MNEQLFNPDGPAISVLAATPSTLADHLMAWMPAHPEWDILRVRGTKSSNKKEFFDEVGAAVQFPYYFGENWDALWDCITELSWLKGSSFLIVFDSAEYLLTQSNQDFEILLRMLDDASSLWHRVTADMSDQPVVFQSVLACDPESVDVLTKRLRTTRVPFEVL